MNKFASRPASRLPPFGVTVDRSHMKTTIEIADDLLIRARREARRERKTLREIVEEALCL
jgi:hypothetical protein